MRRRRSMAPRTHSHRVVRPPPERIRLRDKMFWALLGTAAFLGVAWLLRSVFAVLGASVVFAWLLDPVVDRLQARGVRREIGIAGLFALGAAVAALLVLVVLPSVTGEFVKLAGNLGDYLEALKGTLEEWRVLIEQRLGVHIPLTLDDVINETAASFGEEGEGGLPGLVEQAAPNVGRWLATALTTTLSGGISIVLKLLNLTLLPVFTFYLLRDWDRIVSWTDELVPTRDRPLTRRIAGEIDDRLGSFVRGQILVCMALAVLYSAGLLVSGIDLAIVVGTLSGALFIVPYLGTIFGVVIASLLALLKFGVDWHLLAVWATFGIAQGIEGFLLTPLVVGDKVGLHPLVVMLALLVGGNVFGIWGMLLAIPATAVAQVLLAELLRRYRASTLYRHRGQG